MIMFLGEITTCGLTTLLGAVLALEYLPGVTEMTAIALSGVASHLGVRNFFVYFFSRYGITVTPSAFLRPPHDKPPG
jgi:hypothetical protein